MKLELPTKTVTVRGTRYEIRALDGIKAYALYLRIMKTACNGAERLAGIMAASSGQDALISFLAASLASLSLDDAEQVRAQFAECTLVEVEPGKMLPLKEVFAWHFAGKPKALGLWMFECLQLNFADFLDDVDLSGLMKPAQSAPKSQTS